VTGNRLRPARALRSSSCSAPSRSAAVVCALALFLASGPPVPGAEDEGTSKSLAFATFKEQAGRVTVILGARLGSAYVDEPFLPLQIAVGVYGEGPSLVISPASFVLIDARGTVHPMAPFTAVRDQEVILFVKKLDEAMPLVTGNAFLNYHRASSIFYPQSAAAAGKERVELTHRTFMKDLIYFARPEGGWAGVNTLQFVARGLERPIQVRFTIPITRGKDKPERR